MPTSSTVFLVGSAIGAVLYPVCGRLADGRGPSFVLTVGMGVTVAAFVVMAVTAVAKPSFGAVIVGGTLVVIAAVYPFQYLGANVLAARLAAGSEGSAMGLFNSCVAAGAVVGAVVPSFLADLAGYDSLPVFSAVAVVIALAIGWPVLRRAASPAGAQRVRVRR